MTAIATRMIPEIATKLKIGTAACAIAVAAAFPAQVASAEPVLPAPMAPVTQVLAEPILGPINFAEQFCVVGTPGCDAQRILIGAFTALIVSAATLVLLPVFVVTAVAAAVFGGFFRPGPYGTGV